MELFRIPIPDWIHRIPDVLRQSVEDGLKAVYLAGVRDGAVAASIVALALVVVVILVRK